MKKFIGVLAACLMALPIASYGQATNVAFSGVSLFNGNLATSQQIGSAKLPNFSGRD